VTAGPEPYTPANVRRLPPPGSRKYAAILDTAEERFGSLGFKKASVDDIAAAAGVSRPLVYRYFTSKEELYEVVVDRVISEWCDAVKAQAAVAAPTAAHRLKLVMHASIGFARSRPALHQLLALESQAMLYAYSDVLTRGTETLTTVITDILQQGARDGEIRQDVAVPHMALLLVEVCQAFANRIMSGADVADAPGLLTDVVDAALFGVVTAGRGT
jgi:AcrR family transcriptional regulator